MGVLTDRIDGKLGDLQGEIARTQKTADEHIAQLQAQIVGLTRAKAAISDDIEAAAVLLTRLGVINPL